MGKPRMDPFARLPGEPVSRTYRLPAVPPIDQQGRIVALADAAARERQALTQLTHSTNWLKKLRLIC